MSTKAKFGYFIIIVIYLGCTGNPYTENEINPRNRQIQGSVILGDGLSREGVYVWLEGFNIGVRTDPEGRFQIALPFSASATALSGAFYLYYYVANFDLAATEIFVRNGELLYGRGEINSSGQLNAPKFLRQSLQIQTTLHPTSVSLSDLARPEQPFIDVRCEVVLRAFVDSVIVYFPDKVDEAGPLLFRNIATNQISILNSVLSESNVSDLDTIAVTPTVRTLFVRLDRSSLAAGEYEVIPFLLVKNPAVPTKLLQSLGPAIENFGPAYLEIPFRRQGVNRFLTVGE
jgi:hypothetical protein